MLVKVASFPSARLRQEPCVHDAHEGGPAAAAADSGYRQEARSDSCSSCRRRRSRGALQRIEAAIHGYCYLQAERHHQRRTHRGGAATAERPGGRRRRDRAATPAAAAHLPTLSSPDHPLLHDDVFSPLCGRGVIEAWLAAMPGDASGWLPAAAMPAALSHYHTHVCSSHAWLPGRRAAAER